MFWTVFFSNIYCAPSVSQRAAHMWGEKMNKAHSPSWAGPVGLLGKWLRTHGLLHGRAVVWHYSLKLLILHVQNSAVIWSRGLSRQDLENPPRKISDHHGRVCQACMPNLRSFCNPFVVVLMPSDLCVCLHLTPQHSLWYSKILHMRTHHTPRHTPQKGQC